MRAIELFQDLNHEDMDVRAPPSSHEFFKEAQVAEALDDCLTRMIEEGMFDDCDYRGKCLYRACEQSNVYCDYPTRNTNLNNDNSKDLMSSNDDETYDSDRSLPESEGFNERATSDEGTSRESLTGRFKRYVKRMIPNSMRRGSNRSSATNNYDEDEDEDEDQVDERLSSDLSSRRTGTTGSRNGSRSGSGRQSGPSSYGSFGTENSRSLSRSRSGSRRSDASGRGSSGSRRSNNMQPRSIGSEPYDPSVVYEHDHRHKHSHPHSHHHREHTSPHTHSYHRHPDDSDE